MEKYIAFFYFLKNIRILAESRMYLRLEIRKFQIFMTSRRIQLI